MALKNRILLFSCLSIVTAAFLVPGLSAQNAAQTITLSDKLQIPGATLPAGSYHFSLEDRLSDRAIVRISGEGSDQHYLILGVPNPKLTGTGQDGLIVFAANGQDKGQVARGWACSTCSAPLEFVYPKLEAVAITDKTTEPVMAYDPEYNKLPANLSQDDMKIVTLWLLSPEHITADNVGQGVKAVKYLPDSNQPDTSQVAQATPPAQPAASTPAASTPAASTPVPNSANTPAPNELAANTPAPTRHRLPKTDGNTYVWLIAGLFLVAAGTGLRLRRAFQKP